LRLALILGTALAIAAGVAAAITESGADARSGGRGPSALAADGASLHVSHLAPLLRTTADRPTTLRYDVTCDSPDGESDAACDVDGAVYVRTGAGAYRAIPLVVEPRAVIDRYGAVVPAEIASAPGFSYYAVFHNRQTGETVTLPAGGAVAPQQSFSMTHMVTVALGAHMFGATRHGAIRVASAAWGDAPGQAGLEDGPQLERIGASSFDVSPSGTVTVLDEAHRRLLRFSAGSPSTPITIPVDVRGTIADLRVRPDGTDVLETVSDPGETPVLRSFDDAGRPTGSWHAAESSVGALRLGPARREVLEYPAGQWMPIASDESPDRTLAAQVQGATAGRTLLGGRQLVVEREGREARIALVDAGGVQVGWLITSSTPLAEIQLAEPLGSRVVVVLRVYTDARDEFVALVLSRRGVERQLSILSEGWAETAPLARFRLVGSSLYRLGSTSTGVFVDRYDLEVH
jgi:hypothetical protein